MKPFIALVLGISIASTSNSSDGPRVDCPSGNCPLVQSPAKQEPKAANVVQGIAKAPARVVRSVQSNKPVRSFFKRVFRRR